MLWLHKATRIQGVVGVWGVDRVGLGINLRLMLELMSGMVQSGNNFDRSCRLREVYCTTFGFLLIYPNISVVSRRHI